MKNESNSGILVTFHIGGGKGGNRSFCDDNGTAKRHVEKGNFFHYENMEKVVQEHGFEICDMITDLIEFLDVDSDDYHAFCNRYGDLGRVILVKLSLEVIGEYRLGLTQFRYDIDGDYDTTYGKWIEDCDENELAIIAKSGRGLARTTIGWMHESTEYRFDSSGNLRGTND